MLVGEIIKSGIGAMKKKAKKGKATDKKVVKKGKKKAVKKDLNPGQVLKDISALVEASAEELAEAVIGEGKKGQVSPVKYLFEMAHIFPQATDGSQMSEREESLAETLLDRLKIPKTPVVQDELQKEEDEESKAQPESTEVESEEKDEGGEAKKETVH
jgi:hypothetical protein